MKTLRLPMPRRPRALGSAVGLMVALVVATAWAVHTPAGAALAQQPGGPEVIGPGKVRMPDGTLIYADSFRQAEYDRERPRPTKADGTLGVDATESLHVDGTFWANGSFVGGGLASELNTFFNILTDARTADDFCVGPCGNTLKVPFSTPLSARLSQLRATLTSGASALPTNKELEIWADAGGSNGPQNTATATILDGLITTSGVPTGGGVLAGTEVTWNLIGNLPELGTGRYWVNPIGVDGTGANTRSFFGLTGLTGRDVLLSNVDGFFRSSFFGFNVWTPATSVVAPPTNVGFRNYAFDIDGVPVVGLQSRVIGAGTNNLLDGPWCQTGNFQFEITVSNDAGSAAQPNGPADELAATFGGALIVSGCTATIGTCTVNGQSVLANHALAPGQSVVLLVNLAFRNGIPNLATFPITFVSNYQLTRVTQTLTVNALLTMGCSSSVDPNRQLGCQVHLPILNFEGQDDVCETWVEVQVLGCEPAKATLVTWGEPGFCPPQGAGPLKVECTGLLSPGSTWNLLGAQIPTGSKGGMLFKWSARQLKELGIDLGFDDVVADYMCETLFFGIVGDADDYRRFKKAYNEGLDFAGLPMDIAAGFGYLAVDVLRKCPGDVTPGVKVTSKYNGISGAHLGTLDPGFGGYGYYAPLMYADKMGMTSVLYIQNGGLECSSIEIWFKGQDDCLRAKICEIFALAPGETYQFDASDCVGPDWQGSTWLRSTQPLGIAVDLIGRDVLMTYIAEPAEINFTFDPNKAYAGQGNLVAYGPLVYSEYQGWDAAVQVQNLSGVVNAKVKVYFYDRSGDIITTLVDWICPRGSQTFFLPMVADLPGAWVGSVRVESQEWVSPGSPGVSSPNIVGVVTVIKYSDPQRTETREAVAYNLLPEHKIYDWQLGYGGGGTGSGVGLVAIPSLLKDLDGTGSTSEIAIANVVPKPGFTDLAIFIYDQNGLRDYVCEKLNQKQVEYIDLQTWGYVNRGFKGSAIISATFWEHDVFDPSGRFTRNLVGLGAVAIERSGTRLGEDVPGDEAAGARGIPFAIDSTGQLGCLDRFSRGIGPLCPGVPGERLGSCPMRRAIRQSTDTPLPVADTSAVPSVITVTLPKVCVITDVDVWVALFHTQISDFAVDLRNPAGTTVSLWSNICPGIVTSPIRAIIDDEATPSIGDLANGGQCPPATFRRHNVESPTATNTLKVFEGLSPNGNWTLTVTDTNAFFPGVTNIGSDAGTLYYWELEFKLQ